MRRIWRLPFGERRLRFTPALSSFPGHAPTHEESFSVEGKVAALAPTSAIICCAESHSEPGDYRQPLDCILVPLEQTRDLLIQLTDLLLDELQALDRHLYQPAIDRVEPRAGKR